MAAAGRTAWQAKSSMCARREITDCSWQRELAYASRTPHPLHHMIATATTHVQGATTAGLSIGRTAAQACAQRASMHANTQRSESQRHETMRACNHIFASARLRETASSGGMTCRADESHVRKAGSWKRHPHRVGDDPQVHVAAPRGLACLSRHAVRVSRQAHKWVSCTRTRLQEPREAPKRCLNANEPRLRRVHTAACASVRHGVELSRDRGCRRRVAAA